MSRLIFNAATLGGTTTLSSVDAVGNFTIDVPAATGPLLIPTTVGIAGQALVSSGTAVPIWQTAGTGTVTSVSFTGGLISVANPTSTPALTVAGTSGGVPYFNSASTWASSAVLAANALMIGGGAGATPATTATGTGVVAALGVNIGTAGSFVLNGGALGTPSSGIVTNLTGTASININGTVGATTAAAGAFTTLSATGITTVAAGSAALPAIVSTTGTADTGFWFPAADTIAASTAGTERMRIDSAGFVGIGAAPVSKLDVYAASGYVDARVRSGTNQTYVATDGSNAYFGTYSNIPIVFSTNNINRGIISNSGTWSLGNAPGAESLRATPVASAVNYLNVQGAITTASPSITAAGSDTNIDITLTPKGTGVVQYGTYTAGVVAQAGYITIKDAGGTTRRLLVG